MPGYVLDEASLRRVIRSVLATERIQFRNQGPAIPANFELPPFGLIRGIVSQAYTSSDTIIELTDVVPLGQSAPHPGYDNDNVRAHNRNGDEFPNGTEEVLAIYKEATVLGELLVWEVLKIGSSSGSGSPLFRILLETDVPSCRVVEEGTVRNIYPGVGFGSLVPDSALTLSVGTGGDYWELETDPFGTDTTETVTVWNYNQFKIRCTADDPEDVGTNPITIPQGSNIVFAKKFTYTITDGTDPITETVYEIVPYDFTGGQLVRISDGSGFSPAGEPEALYHSASHRGLLWGKGECG